MDERNEKSPMPALTARLAPRDERMSLRDMLRPLFSHRRLAGLVFWGVLGGALLGAIVLPRRYQAQTEILVTRDRVDAAVTAESKDSQLTQAVPALSEEDINSEVELLKNRDVLEEVVEDCALDATAHSGWHTVANRVRSLFRLSPPDAQQLRAGAVEKLAADLIVEPIKKSNLIRISYASMDRTLAAQVLNALDERYQQKHAAVHRPEGTFGFFDQQVGVYQARLAEAESRLLVFNQQAGIVTSPLQKQVALQELSQFEGQWRSDQTALDGARARERALDAESRATPERQTTQIREAGNPTLLADLNATLLGLQVKQTDLASKYADDYPAVREGEAQISQAQKAIVTAAASPVEDTTTDRVPAHDWMATEMAKTSADRAEFAARAAAEAQLVRTYQANAQKIDRDNAEQDDLARDVKAAEDNLLLYSHKREEARIADALDSRRIVSVSIAEKASVPMASTFRWTWALAASLFVAGSTACGAAYAVDRLDASVHTPDEIARLLGLQTLASLPDQKWLPS